MTENRSSNALAEPAAGERGTTNGRRGTLSRAFSSLAGGRPAASPLRAALWTLGDRLVTLVLGAVMTAQLARYLDVAGYGYYTLAITFVTPFVLITDLANAQVVVREIAGRPQQTRRVIATALLVRGLLGMIAVAACVLRAWTMDYPGSVRTAIVVYSVTLLLAPAEALAAILQARLRLGAISLIGAGATLVNLALILAVVHARAPLPVVLAAAAAPAIVRAVATTILVWFGVYRRDARRPTPGGSGEEKSPSLVAGIRRLAPVLDTALARRLLAASWPLALATLLNLVPGSLPTFCLAARPVPLGTYSAAMRVPMMLSLLPNAVMVGLFPVMARAYLCGRPEARAVLHRAYIALLGLAFPISAGAVALAPEGIHFLYGGAFAASVPGLRVLSVALIAMFPGIAAGHMLVAMGREKVNLAIAVGGAALAGLLTPWLCQRYGADGAAAGVATVTLAMAAASTSCAWWFLRGPADERATVSCAALLPLCLPVALRRIVGCALVMTGVVLVLRRAGLFVAMGGGAALYTFCVWKTGLLHVALRFPSPEALTRPEADGETEGREDGVGESPPRSRDRFTRRLQRRLDDTLAAAFWRLCYWRCKAVPRAVCRVPCGNEAGRLARAGRGTRHAADGTPGASPARILVLDRDYVGDVVCITPALRALRTRFPEAVITLAVAPGVAPLFAGHPDVDRVVALGDGRGLAGAWRLRRELTALAPQSVVVGLGTVPANAWLGHLAGVLCRAEVRLGEAHGRYCDLLTHPVTRLGAVRHWAQIHVDVLAPLGVDPSPARPAMVSSPEDRAAIARWLETHGSLPRPWIALHPGGRIYQIPDPAAPGGLATLSRRWPAERFALLARRLLEASGGTLFLTGAPDDASATAVVVAALLGLPGRTAQAQGVYSPRRDGGHGEKHTETDETEWNSPGLPPCTPPCSPCLRGEEGMMPPQHLPTGVVDTTGRLSLGETAALIQACDLFVTSDTGPMHLAFALDVPTVAIFGPTDPRRVGPLDGADLEAAVDPRGSPAAARHRVLRPVLACSPCAGEALVPCRNPAGQECLTAVSVAAAFAAAMELLEKGGAQ